MFDPIGEPDPERVSFTVGDEDDLTLVDEPTEEKPIRDKFSGSFTLMDSGSSGKNMEPAGFTDRRRRLR